jgi:hypothetical protein
MGTLLGRPEWDEAQHLWRQGRFWEVHEVLEGVWLGQQGAEREFTHTLILLAAALHKARTSPSGGWRNLAKARRHQSLLPQSEADRLQPLVNQVVAALEGHPHPTHWYFPVD